MSSDRDDAQGRSETTPLGPLPGEGLGPHGTGSPAYGQQYGPPQQYGQPPYGQPQQYGQYGPAQPYGGPHGGPQQQYGPYGGPQPPGWYGPPPVVARPGGIVTAAVLGLVLGALGVLGSFVLLVLGAIAAGGASSLDDSVPGLGALSGAIAGVLLAVAVVFIAWTVLMIWGSVWALTGRSRVLLIVAGSIASVLTGFTLISSLSDPDGGGITVALLLFAASVATVVLPSLPSAAPFYVAHRQTRAYAART